MKLTPVLIFLSLAAFISLVFLFTDGETLDDKVNANSNLKIVEKKSNLDTEINISSDKLNNILKNSSENVISSDNNKYYWKKIKDKYGDDFDLIRIDMQSGIINGLEIFNSVAQNGTVEDQTWFIDIISKYKDDALFRDILKTSCCDEQQGITPDKDLGFLVFSFAIEQFNDASAYALMDYYEENILPEDKLKSLYLLGGATKFTAGENMNNMVTNWLENKLLAQSSVDDISIAMAYFRISQGDPKKTAKAEKFLLPLLEKNLTSLDSEISLDHYLGNILPSANLKKKVKSLLENEDLNDLNKQNLREIFEYWNLFETN